MKRTICFFIAIFCCAITASAQSNLITNLPNRQALSLNGKWQYIVDPYETGFYDYRYKELAEKNPDAYWNTDVQVNRTEKKGTRLQR